MLAEFPITSRALFQQCLANQQNFIELVKHMLEASVKVKRENFPDYRLIIMLKMILKNQRAIGRSFSQRVQNRSFVMAING